MFYPYTKYHYHSSSHLSINFCFLFNAYIISCHIGNWTLTKIKKIKRKLLPKLLISRTLAIHISATECLIEIKFSVLDSAELARLRSFISSVILPVYCIKIQGFRPVPGRNVAGIFYSRNFLNWVLTALFHPLANVYIQTKILMLLFKINSHKKKYFDDFLNGYSLAVKLADWLTGLFFHTDTGFIALIPPSVECNKVCIRDYTWTAFSSTISWNFSARFLWLLNSCYGLRMTFTLSLGRL